MTATAEVDRLESERLRPVPPPPGRRPACLDTLDRLIAVLAELLLAEDK